MNLDLQTHINSRCCTAPLNVFTFQEGTVPTIVGNVINFTLKSGLEIDQDVIDLQANNTVTLNLV